MTTLPSARPSALITMEILAARNTEVSLLSEKFAHRRSGFLRAHQFPAKTDASDAPPIWLDRMLAISQPQTHVIPAASGSSGPTTVDRRDSLRESDERLRNQSRNRDILRNFGASVAGAQKLLCVWRLPQFPRKRMSRPPLPMTRIFIAKSSATVSVALRIRKPEARATLAMAILPAGLAIRISRCSE